MDFDRDKAYTEGVFNQGPTSGPGGHGQGSRKTIVNSSMGMVGGGQAAQGGLAAGATGKLAGGKSKKIASGVEGGASVGDPNKSSKSGVSFN